MRLKFSEEQEMLRKAAREFAENVVAPMVEEMEESEKTPPALVRAIAEHDLLAITIPREYGGLGLGHVARMIALEEIGRVSAATAMLLQVMHLGIEPFVAFGTEEQKRKYLPPLARGGRIATVAVTEATGGSDPTGITTEARKDGDHYVVNGRKVFITCAHIADTAVVMVKTGDDPKSFSTLIVEKGMDGFRPGREEHKIGLRGSNTGDLIMENVRVPAANLLGKEGDGLKISLKAISEVGRPGMTGVALGILRAALEEAARFAKQRVLGGNPISKFQAIQWKLAEILTDLEVSRLLAYRAVAMKDAGERCDTEMAMAKYFSTEAAVRAAKHACDIHGGYGLMKEYKVSRLVRDAQALIPSAGTSDIMKLVLARAALS